MVKSCIEVAGDLIEIPSDTPAIAKAEERLAEFERAKAAGLA